MGQFFFCGKENLNLVYSVDKVNVSMIKYVRSILLFSNLGKDGFDVG